MRAWENLHRNSLSYKCRCEAVFAEAISCFTRCFNSKGDCRAAKEHTCLICLANHGRCQGERRLATTSFYAMYSRQYRNQLESRNFHYYGEEEQTTGAP